MGYRSAFITGASSGIGAALAKRLAQQGLEVGLAARREAELSALAKEIADDGGNARVFPLDVTDAPAVTETLLRADEEMDGIDLVVANAGVAKVMWSGRMTWDDAAQMISVNIVGATATLTALIGRMVERERGHLVGISSIAGYRGLPRHAVYSATKSYLSTFLESLRIDLASKKIGVTDIRPGYVRTALNEGAKKLPFEMSATDAANEIASAINSRKAVHAFPFPIAMGIRSVGALPNFAYDLIAPKVV